MSLTLTHCATQLSRQPIPSSKPAKPAPHAMLADAHELVERQHQDLNKLLMREPTLSSLVFQGRSLAELASSDGLNLLKQAIEQQNYDPIAMNHGIRRLRLSGYAGEVIWDYHGNPTTIIERDVVTDALQLHAPVVINEILGSVDYADKFPDSDSLTNDGGLWSYRSFYDRAGCVNQRLQADCPRTSALVDSLHPNLTLGFAFISILAPNTTIASHKGSTSLRQRYHLGISIPTHGVSRIRIGGTGNPRQIRDALGFNDAIDHEVEHWSAQRRIVLIVDTWSKHVPTNVIDAIKKHPNLLKLAVLSQQREPIAMND